MKMRNYVFFILFLVGFVAAFFVGSAACTTLEAPMFSMFNPITLGDLPWWTFVLALGIFLGPTESAMEGWRHFRDNYFAKLF